MFRHPARWWRQVDAVLSAESMVRLEEGQALAAGAARRHGLSVCQRQDDMGLAMVKVPCGAGAG